MAVELLPKEQWTRPSGLVLEEAKDQDLGDELPVRNEFTQLYRVFFLL